ncbi:hypothetical protein ACF0H5_021880 [Mactra antiquata]
MLLSSVDTGRINDHVTCDKKIHQSQGDLVNDMDLHIYPRLQSEFYQDLYKKYLVPLRSKHNEPRDAGRKLFNSRHHVRFKDELEGPVPRCVSSLELRSPGFTSARIRDKHLTNWDREVGHYLKNHTNIGSRECLTSAEPSECSGSVLSVTQRLRQNSQTLKRLLNEESPFRNRFRKENVQYEENIEKNEQSLEEYMLEKSLERSQHRKHQRRIIIQRKILKAEHDNIKTTATDINAKNNDRNKRWMSKSASPTRRNKIHYSLPPPGVHKSRSNGHHVDVDTLLADSDLKIDTLLDNINNKSLKLESPPDSAIDMDGPCITNAKGGNKSEEVSMELSNLYDQAAADLSDKCVNDDMESSPGSSASIRAMRNGNVIYSDNEEENLMVSNNVLSNGISSVELEGEIPSTDANHEIDAISKMVEKYSSCDHLNIDTGPGLLQLYSAEMGYNSGLNEIVDVATNVVSVTRDGESNEQINGVSNVMNDDDKNSIKDHISIGGVNQNGVNSVVNDDNDGGDNAGTRDDVNIIEQEINADIIVESRQSSLPKDMKSARDSDVDSGLGYSSACTDALPPHGRSRPRERTTRPNSKQLNNSCVPLKTDVDVDILNEVNLVHLSHDLTCNLGDNRTTISVNDDGDDTDVRHGVSNMAEEKRLAQKYLRMRSPSPFIVKNKLPSSSYRPNSAPYLAKSENDLRIVDIPLLDTLCTKQSNRMSNSSEDMHEPSDHTTQDYNLHNPSNTMLQPCHSNTNNFGSRFVSMPNLSGTDELGTGNMSSISDHQRNYSSASLSSKESSISPMSDSETDTNTQIYVENYKGAINNTDNTHERAKHSENALNKVLDGTEAHTDIDAMVMTTHSDISKKKGVYKPAITSPRIKEKKMKLSNILKHKKGSFSPSKEGSTDSSQIEERGSVNRIYAKNRGAPNSYENWVRQSNEFVSQNSDKGLNPDRGSDADFNEGNTNIEQNHVNLSKPRRDHRSGRLTPYDVAKTNSLDTESVDNFINGDTSNTVTARPVVLEDSESNHLLQPPTGHMVRQVSPVKAQPPKKPARTKKKHKAPVDTDIDLSKYRIEQNGGEIENQSSYPNVPLSSNELNQSQNSSQSGYQSMSSDQEERKAYRKSLSLQTSPDNEIEVLEHQISNLKASKEMTSSKSSLFDKIKFSKFKGSKKSMSMDQGIDSAGYSPNSVQKSKGSNSFFPKMKKAPSLKSITSLFSRKKKKRGQFRLDDHEGSSSKDSTLSVYSGQSNTLPDRKKQWTSCQALSTIESPNTDEPIRNQKIKSHDLHQPIGKLMKMYPDGTQVIQLTKPDNGPIGFFIAKGSAKYGNGIFISRFSASRPEQCFGGLLGIGDEILEVNSHIVRDLSQDSVYNLISNSPVVVLKIFPFIARGDV